ncbi:hypothetical protein YC2023_099719 [Brassica napus]
MYRATRLPPARGIRRRKPYLRALLMRLPQRQTQIPITHIQLTSQEKIGICIKQYQSFISPI